MRIAKIAGIAKIWQLKTKDSEHEQLSRQRKTQMRASPTCGEPAATSASALSTGRNSQAMERSDRNGSRRGRRARERSASSAGFLQKKETISSGLSRSDQKK